MRPNGLQDSNSEQSSTMAEQIHSRRTVLKWLALAIGAPPRLGAGRPRRTKTRTTPRAGTHGLAKVLASPERVIRHDVGLRQFRRSGFNVGIERLGDKPVIHNYGHGGGGVYLSWALA